MKKFLITLTLCIALALCLPATAFAAQESADAIQSEPTISESVTESAIAENAFLMLYEALGAHLPEVFSALSLLGACILAFCYKRGLLPILRDGIGAIGSATQEWKKNAENYAKETKEICENANNSIQFTNSCIEKIEESIASVEQKLIDLGDQKSENEIFRTLLRGQVDMLYDIFLSSSLPQFEKDRVGKRVEEMRLMLSQKRTGDESHGEE